MLGVIFETISEAASKLLGVIGSVLTSVGSWFYTPGTDGAAGSLTFVGTLSVIALVGSIVFFVIRWIRGLISMRQSM